MEHLGPNPFGLMVFSMSTKAQRIIGDLKSTRTARKSGDDS
jgi:hypothetical protein